jgi:uncharacterized membrane protein
MDEMAVTGSVRYRVICLLIPFLVLGLQLAILFITLDYGQFLVMIGLMIAYILPPAGKETIIPVGIALGFPWWYMALTIVMVDIETCLFMLLNFDLVYKIPYLGRLMENLTEKTREIIERHHWLTDLYFFAIVLMVMVPVLGSGGVRGSIAGKLLSMKNYFIFFAVLTGALIGCFGIALGSEAILNHLCANGLLPPEISRIICNRT